LGKRSKLETHFCEPLEILESIGLARYMFALPASLCIHIVFHVSLLNKYVPDANHVIDWNVIKVEPKGDFQVQSVCIMDRKIKQLHNRVVELVKFQWTWYSLEDATYEREDAMQVEYPHLFEFFL
jgi:hypothetical protein